MCQSKKTGFVGLMITVPENELTFTFSKSSGAGGQNVNKVNTKATLTWDMSQSEVCGTHVKERFAKKYSRFIFDGMVVIHSQRYRSQKQNIGDCIQKLQECLNEVEFPPKIRRKTKPKKSAVKKRLNNKSKQGEKKKLRSEKF